MSSLSDSTNVGSLVNTSLGTGSLFCGDIVEEGGQVLHRVRHGLGNQHPEFILSEVHNYLKYYNFYVSLECH